MATTKAGVIGDPISQSLSPVLHSFWIQRHGLDASYESILVPKNDLKDALNRLADQGYSGVNVTVPHKQSVFDLCDDVTDTASSIGAVNVLTFQDNRFIGGNSDAYGFWMHLADATEKAERPLPSKNAKILLLGAGGAARAVMHAFKTQGYRNITVTNRTMEKAQELVRDFALGEVVPWENRLAMVRQAHIIVNSTSLGMDGQPFLFVANAIPNLKHNQIAYDLVYKPMVTQLLRGAEPKGALAIDGLGMLLHQAVPSFHSFFGINPEVDDALRAHVLSHIQK